MKSRHWLLLAAIFLAALNLRPALSSVSPVLGQIQSGLGLGRAVAGLLVTIPVLCMALFAPLSTLIESRLGRERMILGALVLIGVSTGFRFLDSAAALFGTALFVGLGIAVAQTVLPGIIKENFASRAALITGLYTVGVNLGATLAASATVPLTGALESSGGSWRGALALWGLPAMLAVAAWLTPALRNGPRGGGDVVGFPLRSPRAWLVVGVFSVTALGYFSVLTWLAPLFQGAGISSARSGILLSVTTGCQIVGALAVPAVAVRFTDRRPWLALVICATTVGLLLVAFAPRAFAGAPYLWVVVLGLGQGGLFPLSLNLPLDNTASPEMAGRLTAMAFLFGYALAAAGPAAIGALRDATGGFTGPFAALAAISILQLLGVLRMTPGVDVERP
ncbi:MFS transporter [Rubrobacter aplysinae]|uniref:MFS transporter n=1 Tax=Rubrobacter aplysinae TaxID=909625 RepID=UPI00064C1491|nr:MFS transporter [Rubrobacter aplysinae]